MQEIHLLSRSIKLLVHRRNFGDRCNWYCVRIKRVTKQIVKNFINEIHFGYTYIIWKGWKNPNEYARIKTVDL